jgi:hypothetical protein
MMVIALAAVCETSYGMSCYVPGTNPSMLADSMSPSPQLRAPVQKVLEGMALDEMATEVKVSPAAEQVDALYSLEDMVPVHFALHNMTDVQDVTVVGSWTSWSEHYKLLKKDESFSGWIVMPVGTHQFKFITDGTWITSDQFPVEKDQAGNANNIINVHPPAKTEESIVAEAEAEKKLPGLARAALTPFRFGLEVLFAPFRLILRLFGVI